MTARMLFLIIGFVAMLTLGTALVLGYFNPPIVYEQVGGTYTTETPEASLPPIPTWPVPLDTAAYDAGLLALTDYVPPVQSTSSTSTPPISDLRFSSSTNVTVTGKQWPPAAPYPHGGALLPFNRIVAYYGNFYSIHMGILGEFASSTVLSRLRETAAAYETADPDTPVIPAIHYIAMVAQAEAGRDGMYRAVMPDDQIAHAYDLTQEIEGIMFLDLQIGLSSLQNELPQFRDWMSKPDVHLGLDPEFSMKYGNPPGTVVGTFDATDINYAIDWLSEIVREYELPPKVLIIHRFTQDMVTNYQDIKPTPEVQVVMHMDGWGPRGLKRGTYRQVIEPEPVQFAGVKIFYKNDMKPPSDGIFTPQEVVELHPEPVYIQYQ